MNLRHRQLILNLLALTVLGSAGGCGPGGVQHDSQASPPGTAVEVAIGPVPPTDIENGAYDASLEQAAAFAWSQFIAMNWLAVEQTGEPGTRGVPYQEIPGSVPSPSGLRTWETLRAKTEIFPGIGQPHGVNAGAVEDYGYDEAPLYRYDPKSVGTYPGLEPGFIPACLESQQHQPLPWIELSESHEVGPEKMFAGAAPGDAYKGTGSKERILFSVKVSREFYRYVAAREWLDGGNPGSRIPATATQEYYKLHGRAPEPEAKGLVSFPDQTMQIKTAWRQLSGEEKASGRFHTAVARSYQAQESGKLYLGQPGNPQFPCFVDAEWGMIGIHIKTKTGSAPYYLWATFEQVDTLSDENGQPVEDEAGRLIRNADLAPTDPVITARNATPVVPATPATIQKLTPATAQAVPKKRLYYRNSSGTPTTQGLIAINRRDHNIPSPVIAVNEAAREALRQFISENEDKGKSAVSPVLLNYKLVGIQWKPASKPTPGQDLIADPSETNPVLRYPLVYYLANTVLETSYRLQHYSGTVQAHLQPPHQDMSVQDLITDFDSKGNPVVNVMYDGIKGDGETMGFNMGGCMGCHGQMQIKGYDFNFIFRRGRVNAPEMDVSIRTSLAEMVHPEDYDE